MRKKLRQLGKKASVQSRKQIGKIKLASRHPFAVPVITFALLVVVSLSAWYFIARLSPQASKTDENWNVIVSYDHQQLVVPSHEPTVGALINKLDLKLNPGDVVEPSKDTRINQDEFRVNIYRAAPVKIIDGANSTVVLSAATTPRSLARQADIQTYPEDEFVATPVNNFLEDKAIGEVVSIKRSVPVQLILYGNPIVTRSHSSTVAELLKEKNIVLAKGDTVQPSISTPISANLQVFILRKGTTIVTQTVAVPMPVQTISDPTLSSGTSAIRQQGADGVELITYQVDQASGAKVKLQSVLVQAPITEVVARGTAPVAGTLGVWLDKLRTCETHGNYQSNTGNGYYGAYQFLPGTWNRIATRIGRPDLVGVLPSNAAPADQDAMIVANTNLSSGGLYSQNPGCYYKTGISAFPPPN